MSQICQKAADEFRDYAFKYHNGIGDLDREEVIDYAYSLVQKYGEASGSLACEFYEMVAEMQGVTIQPAQMAAIAERDDVSKALNGAIKQSEKLAAGVVQRLVKQVGADTMVQNAKRDGAYFAWVPRGVSCAYCYMIGAIGWQKAGKNTLRGNHAQHIHANCDCQYVIDFKGDMKIEGYDPEGMQKKIMGIVDPDGMEYDDFNDFLNLHGHNSGGVMFQNAGKDLYKINKTITSGKYLGVPKTWKTVEISNDVALKGTNPNYNRYGVSLSGDVGLDYNINCSNCVPAYEMRRRGYNVSAQPISKNKSLMNHPFDAWVNIKKKRVESLDELCKELQIFENGSRIQINRGIESSIWATKEHGHTFVAEMRNGKIVFIDPQKGAIIQPEDSNICYWEYARIDNAEISDKGITACKKEW